MNKKEHCATCGVERIVGVNTLQTYYDNTYYCTDCQNARTRNWRKNNPEKVKQMLAKWRAANPDKCAQYSKRWAEDNRDEYNKIHRNYMKNRRANDPQFREAYNAYFREYNKHYRQKLKREKPEEYQKLLESKRKYYRKNKGKTENE